MNVISEKEYSFSNALFWNVMLHHHIQAFDEERDVNFDEVWDEELVLTLLDKKKYKKYWCWLSQIDLKTSENQGEIENPRTLTLPIGSDIVLTIEFHPCCTYYFLNDTLIGEVSGNFHLKYLTYSECSLNKGICCNRWTISKSAVSFSFSLIADKGKSK